MASDGGRRLAVDLKLSGTGPDCKVQCVSGLASGAVPHLASGPLSGTAAAGKTAPEAAQRPIRSAAPCQLFFIRP